MLQIEEREIDGKRYQYQPLMLKEARKLFDKLVKHFGPAIAAAVEGLEGADLGEGSDDLSKAVGNIADSAGGFIREVVNGLDEKTHAEICDTLARQTRVDFDGDGKLVPLWDIREMLFGKNLVTEFKVVAFCLEVQYADFLGPLRRAASMAVALRAKAVSNSGSQKPSIGQSTGLQ